MSWNDILFINVDKQKGSEKMKGFKLPKISREEAEKKIDAILSGKEKGLKAQIVRNWAKARETIETKESIRQNLIKEYLAKYNGKTTLKEVQKEVEQTTGIELTKDLKEDKQ